MSTARPAPLIAGEEAYRHEGSAGATEAEALDVALHEALRAAGRPVPGTPRKTRADKRKTRRSSRVI
ncbi:hypothetical protein [Pseudonocardia sp. NPDC049635]|uniref:hypothetical protein n=1 Tax=Pseudonocardia sp. NPDC049635 TaxID=3155506 RepID=UPI0034045210